MRAALLVGGARIAFVASLDRGCRGGLIGISGARSCYFDLYAIGADGGGLEWLVRPDATGDPGSPPAVAWLR